MPKKSSNKQLHSSIKKARLFSSNSLFWLIGLGVVGILFLLYNFFSRPPQVTEIAGVQPFKEALEINNVSSAVILPPMIPSGSFTFQGWIYPASFTSKTEDRYIFSQPSDNSGVQTSLSLQGNLDYNNGNSSLVGWYWDTIGPHTLRTPFIVSANTWHHVAFQRDASKVTIFLDGKQVASASYTGQVNYSKSVLTLGGYNSQPITNLTLNNTFLGKLDDIHIYDHALHNQDFDVPSEPMWQPGIIGFYHLDGDYKNDADLNTPGTPVGTGLSFVASTVPTSLPNPINWQTPQVSLSADDFYLVANGTRFDGRNATIKISSDPGNPNYTTLETTWAEKGREMRVYTYFYAEDHVATTGGMIKQWGISEMRTYNGRDPGDWIYYQHRNPMGWYGNPIFIDRYVLTSKPNVSDSYIVFKNLKLLAFKNYTLPSTSPSPSPTTNPGVKTTITISAAGTSALKVYPNMALKINNQIVKEWLDIRGNANLRTFNNYTYILDRQLNAGDTLQVAYTNDLGARNLRVDKIIVDGKIFETEAKTTFSTGTKNSDGKCLSRYAQSEWLECNGYFQYNLSNLITPPGSPLPI